MRISEDGHWVALAQPPEESGEATTIGLRRKLLEEIVCSASSTVSRVVAVVFSVPHCVRVHFPDRLCVDHLQVPLLVESLVNPTLDAILCAEKLVRGSFGDLWRNTFGSDFRGSQSLNVEQADGNAENEKVPNIYYKIQRFLFSGNFSCGLFLPFQFTSFRKERNRGEEPGDNDTTGVNVSSYGEGTVYVTLLPVVQFIRSFSYVPFRFPNPSLTLFSSEREENEDTFRLTANMGEESFDDLLSLQETSTCLSRPADLVLIERCTARRTYQKSANLQPKDTCECSIEKDNCIKTDTMLFRYVHDFCSICLENYSNSDSLRVLPCLHFFHVVCIDKWLMMDKACPLCKWDIDRGLLYSSWEDSWTSEDHPNNYSSAVATSSAIDLIEQEPEIKWGEWFRSLFSLASSV